MAKKYSKKEIGETIFIIIYLLFLFISQILFLKNKNYYLFVMTLTLGFGDSFHLIPRVIKTLKGDYKNSEFFLGLGNKISSITMTIFYIFLSYLLAFPFMEEFISVLVVIAHVFIILIPSKGDIIPFMYSILAIVRIILCMLPQNNWYKKEGNFKWSIIRNIPFTIMGIITVGMAFYYKEIYVGILVLLSFAFYLPVVLFNKKNPKVGMLMIPKTVMYILIIARYL